MLAAKRDSVCSSTHRSELRTCAAIISIACMIESATVQALTAGLEHGTLPTCADHTARPHRQRRAPGRRPATSPPRKRSRLEPMSTNAVKWALNAIGVIALLVMAVLAPFTQWRTGEVPQCGLQYLPPARDTV